MAKKICAACGQWWYPHEEKTNELVGQAAQLPGIELSVWRTIWPDITASDCQVCGSPLGFRAGRTGADWVLSCPAGHIARQAEHKPGGAPGQWSWATADDYKRAVSHGLIVPGQDWRGIPAPWHDQIHLWTNQCARCNAVKGAGQGMVQLTLPQVVRYRLDNKVPCTLVTDQGDATNVYVKANPILGDDFIITAAVGPVRTTPSVLNSLAGALRRCSLSNDQQRLICDIATRMWWRLPWDQVRSVYAPARALVKPVAYHCGWNHPA
jgi:hypothetical protein